MGITCNFPRFWDSCRIYIRSETTALCFVLSLIFLSLGAACGVTDALSDDRERSRPHPSAQELESLHHSVGQGVFSASVASFYCCIDPPPPSTHTLTLTQTLHKHGSFLNELLRVVETVSQAGHMTDHVTAICKCSQSLQCVAGFQEQVTTGAGFCL